MNALVTARDLSKFYGATKALDDVSFTVEPGTIIGLIGPNGAGKTTTLKALLGLTDFEGDLDVVGADPRRGRHRIMEKVCFISDVGILPRWLRVSEALDFVEAVHPRFHRDRAEKFLADTKINHAHKVKELSKGMVTQLHLSLVLAIEAELLVLDEPTLGLDIVYQKAFFDRILTEYLNENSSVIISTHQVEEVKSVLSHLILLNEGRIVLNSSMDELGERYCQVTVKPGQYESAAKLKPIITRDLLGCKTMIFEDIDRSELEVLGQLHIPSVTDLFIAKTAGAEP
jgi:ABC-2 type transport system ATP-binding protein